MTHQLLPYKYQTVFIMKKVATMNISEKQIRNIVRESIKRSLKNRLNESTANYETYVLVNDSDGSVIGNYTEGNGYDAKAEAIMDAKERAGQDRYGSYTVYGCTDEGYDDTTIVFSTAGEDVHLFNLEESVVKRCVAKVLKEYDHHDPDSDWESEVERADAMRDQEKDKYVDSLEEDDKNFKSVTNTNVDVSETLGHINQCFVELNRSLLPLCNRRDMFGEELSEMAYKISMSLSEMKKKLNTVYTNSQNPQVNRRLRPRKM